MAVRNNAAHLSSAIESVLAQSFANFEFIIIDDASTDGSRDILESFQQRDARVRVIGNDRCLAPYPSANLALRASRGTIIARHDGDDISPPDRFATQLAAIEGGDAEVVLVTGRVETFADAPVGGRFAGTWTFEPPSWQPLLEWELLFWNVVGAGAHVMFRRV